MSVLKYLDFSNLRLHDLNNLSAHNIKEINQLLEHRGFFEPMSEKEMRENNHPSHYHVAQRFYVLRLHPDNGDSINGGNFIRKECVDIRGKMVCSETYNFGNRIIETSSA